MNKSKLLLITIALCTKIYASNVQSIDTFLSTNPSIAQIHTGFAMHNFSCKELIGGYLERIRLYNLTTANNLAPLNAITQLNPQALFEAEKLDAKLATDPTNVGSLFCIPVIVKDNIDVAGLRTSSGSSALLGTYPLTDAKIVLEIKEHDGIILAKSSMDELASGLSGMSSLSGRVGNAYNSNYSSGGSSGGSAVSVASGFAQLAIGTDNSGSVRIPAAYNGIYGLRPTYGLISNAGIFPLGNLDGTAGPMANNVTDLAKLLTVMTDSKVDYSKSLSESSLWGKHFAIVRSVEGKSIWDGMPQPIMAIYKDVEMNLQKQGATLQEIDLPKYKLDRKNNMAGTVDAVNNYLAHNISNISQFKDVCLGNSRVFGKPKNCVRFIDSIKSKNSSEYQQVIKTVVKNQVYVISIMHAQHLDGLILPSGKSGIASYDGNQIGNQSIIASNSGLPEITLPVAQYGGLPVGLEILGEKYSESALLSYAFAYQQHCYSFKAPRLNPAPQFTSWSIGELNILYLLIGKIGFESVIKHTDHNKISPQESTKATKEAISLLQKNHTLLQ